MDQDDELTKALVRVQLEVGQGRVVVDKSPEEAERDYWARQMDSNQIKVVNWSRKRKRSKNVWSSGRGGSGGGNPERAVDKLRNMLGGN